MRVSTIISMAAVAAFSISVSAHAGVTYHDNHGEKHHTHTDGNWHGKKPHKHGGKWMHRGHTHECRCDNFLWHDNRDLQRLRVIGDTRPCYDDHMHDLEKAVREH